MHFLTHPTTEAYVKELSNILKIGPTSANNALWSLKNMGLLQKRERARSHFYSLNNDSIIVNLLKRAYFIARLQDTGVVDKLVDHDEALISLCVYGSFANGTFDEKSDLDLLVISQNGKSMFNTMVGGLEKALGLEVNIEVFNLSQWKALKKKDNGFYKEILASHILLYGSEI